MSSIRRQSIISSLVVYAGFALGLVNMWFFTNDWTGFTDAQYGLTQTFVVVASILFSVAGLGMPAFISKFFPYYKAHLADHKNDQLTWALIITIAGFAVVAVLAVVFKPLLIDRIFNNSPELPKYFLWTIPFALGYSLFMVAEPYAWQQREAVLSNFLKEVVFRLFTTALILLTIFGLIKSFDTFIGIYTFSYLALFAVLLYVFKRKNKLHFTTSVSIVTRRFFKKILTLASFVWGGGIIFNLANVFDGIVISAILPNGMAAAGIFYLAQNISSLMQAPQRAVISAAIGPLSQAWKEKDHGKIQRIYQRSSINQLLFATAMFGLIWLNFEDGIRTFHLRESFLQAKWIFFYIGLARIVDMGTGLNSQIISTSTFWRFEFLSGVILLALTLPLNWFLTQQFALVGPAISNLISFFVYNLIRGVFLYRKMGMQPFTWNTLWTLLLAAASYLVAWALFSAEGGLLWMILRSAVFIALFAIGTITLRLSPDVQPVWLTVKKRMGLVK